MTKAEASEKIEELQEKTGRGAARTPETCGEEEGGPDRVRRGLRTWYRPGTSPGRQCVEGPGYIFGAVARSYPPCRVNTPRASSARSPASTVTRYRPAFTSPS